MDTWRQARPGVHTKLGLPFVPEGPVFPLGMGLWGQLSWGIWLALWSVLHQVVFDHLVGLLLRTEVSGFT